MTPEYLYELAEIADPEELWRLTAFDQLELPPKQRKRLDTGIALRRHAAHIEQLRALLGTGKSLLITPLGPNSTAAKAVETPADHKKLLRD